MKKKIIFVFCCLTIFLLGIMMLDKTMVRYHIIETERVKLANTFDELENESDLILKATILPDKENKLDILDDGTVLFGYTHTIKSR